VLELQRVDPMHDRQPYWRHRPRPVVTLLLLSRSRDACRVSGSTFARSIIALRSTGLPS
jgi:hypothetical protein